MTLAKTCPPHHWDLNGNINDGLVLAKCMRCPAQQWQAVDGSKETVKRANELNQRDHFNQVEIAQSRRFFGSEKETLMEQAPQAQPETPRAEAKKKIVKTGAFTRYDLLAPQVIEDAKSMSWQAACLKHGIAKGSAPAVKRRWEHAGLLPERPASAKPTPRHRAAFGKYDNLLAQIKVELQTMTLADVERKHRMGVNTLSGAIKRWIKRGLLPADYKRSKKAPRATPAQEQPTLNVTPMEDVTKKRLTQFFSFWLTGPSHEQLEREFNKLMAELNQQSIWLKQTYDVVNSFAALEHITLQK